MKKMITMKITRVDRNNDNTPILTNKEIDEFAYAVLEDYDPGLLREPGAIDYEHFMESYLGVEIIYKDIYYQENTPPIHAVTVFRGGTVKVFDRENGRVAAPIIRANTVIIDNAVTNNAGMAMFTGLHESGHIFMHQDVFSVFRAGQVCCRKKNMGGAAESDAKKIRTAEEWREHQANHFAGAVAMPDATFGPFVAGALREYGVYRRGIILGDDADLDIVASDLLPERISEVYGVSKQAAAVKLKKNGFVVAPA